MTTILLSALGVSVGLFQSSIGIAGLGLAPLILLPLIAIGSHPVLPAYRVNERIEAQLLFISLWLLMCGLLLATLMSGSSSVTRAVVVVGQYMFTIGGFAYLIFNLTLDKLSLLTKAYVYGTWVLVTASLVFYFVLPQYGYSLNFIHHSGRLQMMENANSLATHVALACGVVLLFARIWFIPGWLQICAVLASGLTILITGSHGGMIIYLLIIVTAIATTTSIWMSCMCIIATIMIFVSVREVDVARFASEIPPSARVLNTITVGLAESSTFSERAALNEEAWRLIQKGPLIGHGAGFFLENDPLGGVYAVGEPHNAYLLLWAEGGILGVLGLCGIVAALFLSIRGPFLSSNLLWAAIVCGFTLALAFRTHAYQPWLWLPILAAMRLRAR
jgi:O-antigen ligase